MAEQTSEEQATWHRIYSTGKSAERIKRADLAKGDRVNVDGYRQGREQKKRDSSTIRQEVVFAVHVKKVGQRTGADQPDSAPDK